MVNTEGNVTDTGLATPAGVIEVSILKPASPLGTESRIRADEPVLPVPASVTFWAESVTAEDAEMRVERSRRETRARLILCHVLSLLLLMVITFDSLHQIPET